MEVVPARELKEKLERIEKSNQTQDWFSTLTSRKRAELDFHNRDRDRELTASLPQDTYELLHGNKKYYSTVALSQGYIENWFRTQVPGRVFLDYACGNGLQAMKAAQLGAELAIGVDISDVSVRNASESARGLNLEN